MERVDCLILGAGAAGLMAAIEAARRGRSVLVVDHAAAAGEKIRISGGGRCNFTNLHIAPDRFLSDNPRFALSALRRYTQHDFIARMNHWGIAWHEKTLGQLFCDGSAKQVVAALLDDLAQAGGRLWLDTTLGPVRHDGRFAVETSRGTVSAARLIVALGGRSIPKMGATGLGYDIARQFGLRLVDPRPGLVPLTFSDALRDQMAALAGLSLPARVSYGKIGFEEGLLFTHRGLSGPSILQISSYWREGTPIAVDLMPGKSAPAIIEGLRRSQGRSTVAKALTEIFPERLARAIANWQGLDARMADLRGENIRNLVQAVGSWTLLPMGSEGWRTAEVTVGGVDTRDLDARTLAARNLPDLHFVGEVVDVTGWLGGYNFQWAWSSGWAAGQAA